MVRNLIIFLSIFLIGCEISGKQIIKPEKLDVTEIKFNAVTKKLIYENYESNIDSENMKNIINYWFDNKIKTDGFEGSLEVIISNLDFSKIKNKEYFKFTLDLEIIFIEKKLELQKTKTYQVKASEFGEINGNFSIKDQENLVINIMHKSLTSISRKINSMN